MTSQFQNRLVGTIVLVALGVIFLPDLLDGKQRKVEEVFTEIPLRSQSLARNTQAESDPQAEPSRGEHSTVAAEQEKFQALSAESTPAQQQLEGASPPISSLKPIKMVDSLTVSAADSKKLAPAAVKSTEKAKTAVKTVSRPEASQPTSQPQASVTLQLGGFNSADNVVALVAQLRKAGFTAYTLPRNPVDGRLTKVFVGPDVSEAKLKIRQVQIEKLTGLKGKIVPYNPLER
ncbi:Sporulation related [Shewanella denitrificans OS217]|uniref:Sporulation related n=1 Tax=Shewanella denitrificans (strain OS217 / ATCC BAA-1090 / DSM 15013) TaxID=318161 RepID=Q12P53_SHEDO|nr:cell division protein DedD [Shewanella denitrificans]ABE54773.1 Sporulation related [Shewanella denitrificans OS217]